MKSIALRGQTTLVAIVIVATLIVAGGLGIFLRGGSGDGRGGQPDSFIVKRGDFDISIPVSGELAALKQIEIRNSLDGRAVITEIVAEGTFVNAGEILMRLNDEETRTKLRDAQDKVNVADAALVAAQAKLDIQLKTQKAELDKANLAITLADLALKAWQEGELVAKRQQLALAIETADKEYARLDARFKESGGLLEKKFISLDEYKRDEIAMMKAKSDLELARLNAKVYEDYQFQQEQAQKTSNLDQARSERERVEQQNDAEVRSAQSDVDSKKYQFDSAKEKLAELQQQLEFCTVKAPASGLVVYFASTQTGGMGRNEGRPPQVGTELTRNELVIILPNTSQMIAAVKISEALVGQIESGQRATITCDAMPARPLSGEVQSVGVMAESGGWRDPNRRDYTVKILMNEGADLGLKPSMRCKANIDVGRVESALHIPVQAVFRSGPIAYVYVAQGSGYAQRKVSVGRSSELFIEVLEGLKEAENVLLREPQPEEVVSRIPMPKDQPNQGGPGQQRNGSGAPSAGEQAMPQNGPIRPPGQAGPDSPSPGDAGDSRPRKRGMPDSDAPGAGGASGEQTTGDGSQRPRRPRSP